MIPAVVARAAMAMTAPFSHDHALDPLMPVVAGVLHSDGMAAPQLPMIVRRAPMIKKRHISSMAIASLLIVAKPEADEVATIALVKSILMVCEGRGRQNRGYCCEDNN